MKALIVGYHPEPTSFNRSMLKTAKETLTQMGAEVRVTDLRAIGFNPVPSYDSFTDVQNSEVFTTQLEELHATKTDSFSSEIENHIQDVEWCDMMIWQFPLWWFGMPAVFKGWVDRVFTMGRVYGGKNVFENGKFKGKRAMLSVTTGVPKPMYKPGSFAGDFNEIVKPIHRGILEFTGWDVLAPHHIGGPASVTKEEREAELAAYAERLRSIADEDLIDVGRY